MHFIHAARKTTPPKYCSVCLQQILSPYKFLNFCSGAGPVALAACNNAANSSFLLSVDKVSDGSSPHCESQYTTQGLLKHVERSSPLYLRPFYQVTGCDQAGFMFVHSTGGPWGPKGGIAG